MFISYDGMMIDPNRVMYYYHSGLRLEGGLTLDEYDLSRTEEQSRENYEVEKRLSVMANFVSFGIEGGHFFNTKYAAGYKIMGRRGDDSCDRDWLMVFMTDGQRVDIYDDDVASVLRILGRPE